VRVRALKAAPDTAGLYFLMKGSALHPFEEGKRGNSPINRNFLNYTTKAPACQLELYAKKPKQIFGNLLQKRGKYGIIVCVCVTSIHVFHGWSAASLCMNTPDIKEAK
jgi:hypothetical protein